MARKKISQLESAVDVTASDLIQIVDVEDGDMAPSGTNKKATAQLLANELGKLTNVTSTGSTTARSLANRFADVVNVKDFGAVGDGVTDDTAAFESAISAAVGSDTIDNSWNIQFPLCVTIYVPSGNYLLNSIVDVKGKDVTYILSHGASFSPTTPQPYTGTNRLNGRVVRDGLHFSANHFGIKDKAGTLSIHGFTAEGYDEGAFINGFSNPSQLADVLDRDSCSLVVSNRNPAPYATIATANYTSTTIVPASPLTSDEVKLLKVGMTIDTLHATKYSGFVTSWANNGSSITVSGWFQQGNQSSGQVPTNGFGALVQNFTKVFSQNNLVWLDRGVNKATRCAGFELDLHNNRSSPGASDPSGNANTDYLWGFDSAATGRYESTVAYLARGPFKQAFHALPKTLSKTVGASYNRVSTTVTVTSTAHGLTSSDIVKISSASDSGINGYHAITVTSLDSFTFTTDSIGVSSGTLDWECKDYSNVGYLYQGDGVGLKFNNITSNNGTVIQTIDSSFGQTTALYANGDMRCLNTARAWVNFNGDLSTPITPRNGFNVSSITKTGTGQYTINFLVPMLNTNYCTLGSFNDLGGGASTFATTAWNTGSVSIALSRPGVGFYDHGVVNVAIFNNNY